MVHPLTGERGLFIGGGRPSYSVKGRRLALHPGRHRPLRPVG